MTADAEPIYCEVCQLPHRRGVAFCEDCGHRLGSPPDWEVMRGELGRLQRKMALGAAVFAAMLVANYALFGGAGYVVLTAPIGWIVFSAYHHRVISRRLRALPK